MNVESANWLLAIFIDHFGVFFVNCGVVYIMILFFRRFAKI